MGFEEYLVKEEYKRQGDRSRVEIDEWMGEWELIDISPDEMFQQKNRYDCGIFTFLFMAFHSQDLPLTFTQDDVYRCCDGRGVRSRLAHMLWKLAQQRETCDLSQYTDDED